MKMSQEVNPKWHTISELAIVCMWQTSKNISNQYQGRGQHISYRAPAPLHIR